MNSDIAETYLSKLRSLNTNTEHVTDKLPANFLHSGLIRVLRPRARIIHCVRES
ncbi:MAG: sulfotransferase [Proteobacteria bacterium]|nr:sulfotransferase [Pseudomonadota bacterium]